MQSSRCAKSDSVKVYAQFFVISFSKAPIPPRKKTKEGNERRRKKWTKKEKMKKGGEDRTRTSNTAVPFGIVTDRHDPYAIRIQLYRYGIDKMNCLILHVFYFKDFYSFMLNVGSFPSVLLH